MKYIWQACVLTCICFVLYVFLGHLSVATMPCAAIADDTVTMSGSTTLQPFWWVDTDSTTVSDSAFWWVDK